MSVAAALRNERLCRALTGLGIQEFKDLVEPSSMYYEAYWAAQRKHPQRRYGAGRKGCHFPFLHGYPGKVVPLSHYRNWLRTFFDPFSYQIICFSVFM